MSSVTKLDSIIAKAQLIRRNERITPIEMVLSDLVESLALELKRHQTQGLDHPRVIGGAVPGRTGW